MKERTRSSYLWMFAFALGLAFELLFWGRRPGISVPLFVSLVLLAGFVYVRMCSVVIDVKNWALVAVVWLAAVFCALRAEPMTLFLNYLTIVTLGALVADGVADARWTRFKLFDFPGAVLGAPLRALWMAGAEASRRWENRPHDEAFGGRAAIVRGLLIALPIVIVMAALLGSADSVFGRILDDLFGAVWGSLGEALARGLLIVAVGYMVAGIYLNAISPGKHIDIVATLGLRGPSLGRTEVIVVLAAIDLLFGAFVAVQLRYFFGGERAIAELGLTYAEYARRGFGELVAVSALTLVLLLALMLTLRKVGQVPGAVNVLGSLLVGLTIVILLSSFQRLYLYEQAYGFTRLRMYSHMFIVWLGVLLIAVTVLSWADSLRRVGVMCLTVFIGFSMTMNLVGVDSLIARHNLRRAQLGAELDVAYLASLSDDAVPALTEAEARSPSLRPLLVCRALAEAEREDDGWLAAHWSHLRASQKLDELMRRVSMTDQICSSRSSD